jgi:hypothetical protein
MDRDTPISELASGMRSAIKLVIAVQAAQLCLAAPPIILIGDEPGSWTRILNSAGWKLSESAGIPAPAVAKHAESGSYVILQGSSEAAGLLGIRPTAKRTIVRSIVDEHNPKLPIVWEHSVDLPVFELPAGATIFARDRSTGAPLVAGFRKGAGAILWTAAGPGSSGYDRFPYLLQALTKLGLEPPLRSNRLWAFFDSSYRLRVDPDYFAERWRKAGIAALHVAGWHFAEPDAGRDAYLKKLIDAVHRNGILVYVWLELPHVSEQFWQSHPEWREKTAVLQDAHLDWRKLMNLQNPACFRAASDLTRSLIERFDWDGVNLAELYFESLEGTSNPARFTPMNDDVRAEYKALMGVDPLELFRRAPDKEQLQAFLSYRAELVRNMQRTWIAEIEKVRRKRPHLDLVLTHVDDRYDTKMRELIGADAARVLPMLEEHDFTFLIEDPATIWHLGPERYPQIASKYEPLTAKREKLAIDINIVERYQDVYPTKQQTGTELLQLVHLASKAFERVALYFENSLLKPDLPLLPAAAAVVSRYEQAGGKTIVESSRGVGVAWNGAAKVNGKLWPVSSGKVVWLPPGPHVVEPAGEAPGLRLVDFNGELRSAISHGHEIEFAYQSSSRAIAIFDRAPGEIQVDGEPADVKVQGRTVLLPRGQHIVTVKVPSSTAVTKLEDSASLKQE